MVPHAHRHDKIRSSACATASLPSLARGAQPGRIEVTLAMNVLLHQLFN
jgi:hypothetical protein